MSAGATSSDVVRASDPCPRDLRGLDNVFRLRDSLVADYRTYVTPGTRDDRRWLPPRGGRDYRLAIPELIDATPIAPTVVTRWQKALLTENTRFVVYVDGEGSAPSRSYMGARR
jgi:hypothetical protein